MALKTVPCATCDEQAFVLFTEGLIPPPPARPGRDVVHHVDCPKCGRAIQPAIPVGLSQRSAVCEVAEQ